MLYVSDFISNSIQKIFWEKYEMEYRWQLIETIETIEKTETIETP